MITLTSCTFSEGGKRIDYHYTANGSAKKFLNPSEQFYVRYDQDVSSCPLGVVVIPFVANFITIAWFAKFDLVVPEIDAVFLDSMLGVQSEFQAMHPRHRLAGRLKAKKSTKHSWSGKNSLMLFSGGMDAYTTLIRHYEEKIDLVTILGADIETTDIKQWNRCLNHIKSEAFSGRLPHFVVETNMRTFYNDNVEVDLIFGWWGRVQHGPGLLGLMAPLSFARQASLIYIASSYCVPMVWGSTKASDEKISWGALKVIHDASELSRQAKAKVIVAFAKEHQQPIQLRVCYSEVERDGNCGHCEKCYRTIMNIVLAGADPRKFGFPFSSKTYPSLMACLKNIRASAGLRLFWGEISDAARVSIQDKIFFILENKLMETEFVNRIADGEIDRALMRNHCPWRDSLARWKFIIRVRFPRFYNLGRSCVRFIRLNK